METLESPKQQAPAAPSPERLFQLATGFWASKVLFAAVKLDLFTVLGQDLLSVWQIRRRLGLNPRSILDFLDALVALGLLVREGDVYGNTQETALFLDRNSRNYVGDMFLMSNERLWGFWGRLEEALRTGLPQNETREDGTWVLDILYNEPRKRDLFLKAMIGLSAGSSQALAQSFDFQGVRTFCDIGGGPGTLCAAVAQARPQVHCVNMDLPAVEPVFRDYLAGQGLPESRVRFHPGDCFKDPLPPAEAYAMGHLLHGWGGGSEPKELLAKAHRSLPSGGVVLVIESLIDDERRKNLFGLLMSLDMLLETPKGRNFTIGEITAWLRNAGFQGIEVRPLAGPHSVAIGRKP